MADADTRQSFWVDSELWQPPGQNKLRWWERKLAIYLRKVAGVFEADGEVHPHAVMKAVSTMAAATGLSENKVRLAIVRLRSWPKDNPFITDEGQIRLRPLPAKKVRIAMWLWESPLPDDWKDVLWFVRSQFITKDDRGEIFRCAIKGRQMASILRCCYVAGAHWKARGKRVHRLLGWMAKAGMTEVVKPATSKSAALVLIHDEEPNEKVKKLCEYYSQVARVACRVASKTVSGGQQKGVGWPAKPCRVASKTVSGGPYQYPFQYPRLNILLQ